MFSRGIFYSDIFGVTERERAEERNVMTGFGPAEWGYLGLGAAMALVVHMCVCVRVCV